MSFTNIQAPNFNGATDSKGYLDAVNNSLLSAKGAKGISGWVFDIDKTENIEVSSDITDHYTENNSYINDHIVRKPQRVTLSGYIGELFYQSQDFITGVLSELDNKLGIVDAYLGDYTDGMIQNIQGAVQQAETVVSDINKTIDKVQNVVGFFAGESYEETRQGRAYQELKALWLSNTLLTVQTPWDYFQDMVIESISVIQDEDSKTISDFSITLKQLRFAGLEVTEFDENLFPPREEVQKQSTADQGNVTGESDSFLYSSAAGAING